MVPRTATDGGVRVTTATTEQYSFIDITSKQAEALQGRFAPVLRFGRVFNTWLNV
jgi:hypothetical protein